MVIAFVVRLLNIVRPSTIFWRVRPIVVNTLNRMLWRWSLPHIGVEVFKGVEPAFAHDDASPAVTRIRGNVGISATRLDVRPTAILRRVDHAVCSIGNACGFAYKAAAASSMSTTQVSTRCDNLGSAVTNAAPHSATRSVTMRISQHDKPRKALPANVFDLLAWKWRSINCVHVHHDNIFGKAWQVRSVA